MEGSWICEKLNKSIDQKPLTREDVVAVVCSLSMPKDEKTAGHNIFSPRSGSTQECASLL
jgi:hypothetical protein